MDPVNPNSESKPEVENPSNEDSGVQNNVSSAETSAADAKTKEAGGEGNASDNAASGPLTEDKVREELKQVIDPELFVNIVDLGLIYVVDIEPNEEDETKHDVTVEMTMTSPMCPAGPQLVANSRQAVESIPSVEKVEIKVVMDPPWTQDMMTEDARDQLNIF